jgi:hypothetical protein
MIDSQKNDSRTRVSRRIRKRTVEITYPPEMLPRYEDGGDVFVCDGANAYPVLQSSSLN